jgi:hypothetical protein
MRKIDREEMYQLVVEMILIFILFISIVKICDFLHLCKSVRFFVIFFVRFFVIHVLVVVSAGVWNRPLLHTRIDKSVSTDTQLRAGAYLVENEPR